MDQKTYLGKPVQHFQPVFHIHIVSSQKRLCGVFQISHLLTQLFKFPFQGTLLPLCLFKLDFKGVFPDKRDRKDLRFYGAGHPVLVFHAFPGNRGGILLQILVSFTHLHLSKDHMDVTSGIFVFGGYRLGKSPLRRFLELLHALGIDKPGAIRLFFSPQPVINPQGNIKVLRFYQDIETLGIQISFYCVSPAFICNLQHFTEYMRLCFSPQPSEFLPDCLHQPLHSLRIRKFLSLQPLDLPFQLFFFRLLFPLADLYLCQLSLYFSIHLILILDHLVQQCSCPGRVLDFLYIFKDPSAFSDTGVHIFYFQELIHLTQALFDTFLQLFLLFQALLLFLQETFQFLLLLFQGHKFPVLPQFHPEVCLDFLFLCPLLFRLLQLAAKVFLPVFFRPYFLFQPPDPFFYKIHLCLGQEKLIHSIPFCAALHLFMETFDLFQLLHSSLYRFQRPFQILIAADIFPEQVYVHFLFVQHIGVHKILNIINWLKSQGFRDQSEKFILDAPEPGFDHFPGLCLGLAPLPDPLAVKAAEF